MLFLTSEEAAQLRKAQKRRLILALVLGTIMAILSYFAGQKLAGGNINEVGAVYADVAIMTAMGKRTLTAADFEGAE